MADTGADRLTGTVTLHNANWKPDLLASQVEIAEATLHLGGADLRWDPVEFSYGPVKGTASLQVPLTCESDEPCAPRLEVHFAELDAGKLQAALLGAKKPDTLLSTLIARLTPSQSPVWPRLDGTLKADSLVLGPVTLHDATAMVRIQPAEAAVTSLDAALLGGRVHVSGTVTSGATPAYLLEGEFDKLGAAPLCQLLGLRCTGGVFNGNGKVALSGFTGKDLAASAKGALHFEWRNGAVRGHVAPPAGAVPHALARFDRWTGDAKIANGAVTLAENQVQQGSRKATVEASVPFSAPLRVTFTVPKEASTAKR